LQVIKSDKKDLWYLDSGCSRHMIGDKTKFAKLELKKKGFVTYEDNNKGRRHVLSHLKVFDAKADEGIF